MDFTASQQERIVQLALQLEGLPGRDGLSLNIESFASSREAVARERAILRAAIALSGRRFKIEEISGYYLRAVQVLPPALRPGYINLTPGL